MRNRRRQAYLDGRRCECDDSVLAEADYRGLAESAVSAVSA